jgi:hypothetical protein
VTREFWDEVTRQHSILFNTGGNMFVGELTIDEALVISKAARKVINLGSGVDRALLEPKFPVSTMVERLQSIIIEADKLRSDLIVVTEANDNA